VTLRNKAILVVGVVLMLVLPISFAMKADRLEAELAKKDKTIEKLRYEKQVLEKAIADNKDMIGLCNDLGVILDGLSITLKDVKIVPAEDIE